MAVPNRAERRRSERASLRDAGAVDSPAAAPADRPLSRLAGSACRSVRVVSTGSGVLLWALIAGALASSVIVGLLAFVVLSVAVWYDRDRSGS